MRNPKEMSEQTALAIYTWSLLGGAFALAVYLATRDKA